MLIIVYKRPDLNFSQCKNISVQCKKVIIMITDLIICKYLYKKSCNPAMAIFAPKRGLLGRSVGPLHCLTQISAKTKGNIN